MATKALTTFSSSLLTAPLVRFRPGRHLRSPPCLPLRGVHISSRGPSTHLRQPSFVTHRGLIRMSAADQSTAGSMEYSTVVDAKWLHDRLDDVRVLDASWYMPAEKRNPYQEYKDAHIPGALFFDFDKIADVNTDLPHMLPSEEAFAAAVSCLGITNNDDIVVYDGKGLFSAPRVWWMFRAFGHKRVRVLEGGLPGWIAAGYQVQNQASEDSIDAVEKARTVARLIGKGEKADFKVTYQAKLQPDLVRSLNQVVATLEKGDAQLVDARGKGRFEGKEPEPRAGVRGGHMPGARNVPFVQVLTSGGYLKSEQELAEEFKQAGVDLQKPIVTTCGTGVTACVLALALHKIGRSDVAIYDGSWTEWGGSKTTAVVTDS